MDATELRALADALEPMARAPRFEDMDVPAFCRWLRAQADAQPVAWLHDVVQDGDEPDQALSFYRDSFPLEGVGGFRSIGCVPLYLHPAPAVPAGWKLVPVEPTEAHLASMGMRHRHDYGMLDEKFQDSIRCQMRQLYEEAIGEGFFRIAAPAVPTGDYSANGEPLYTPPAAPAIEERGPWFAERDQQRAWVDSDDFTHDARLYVNGDFESNDQRFAYAQEIARRLNAAPAAPQAEPIDPHMIVAEDRFPDVPAERWKPCPQCGEDFDRECPICDGLGRVLATDGEQAEPKREPRPCTCHPDDNPPVPCAQKYALNECRATRSGPDEAQIEQERSGQAKERT